MNFKALASPVLDFIKDFCKLNHISLLTVFKQNSNNCGKNSWHAIAFHQENKRLCKNIGGSKKPHSSDGGILGLYAKTPQLSRLGKPDMSTKAGSKDTNVKAKKPPIEAEKPVDRRVVKVYRYEGINSPNQKTGLQTYEIDVSKFTGQMALDLLIEIKKMDPTLTYRRSCRESICGSCSINLQGSNCLACSTQIPKDKVITIYPIPHMYVIRDLVVDMDHFLAAYNSVRPYIIRKTPTKIGAMMFAQSVNDQLKFDGLYECILCACCSTSCPSYWWNGRRFLGPAALLHSYRWVIDSRDEDHVERLRRLRDDFKAYRCHTIMNCAIVCPKKLNPANAIAKLKRLIAGLDTKPYPEIPIDTFKGISQDLIKGLAERSDRPSKPSKD